MPEFDWRAVDRDGRVLHGRSDAATVDHAMRMLKSQGLVPLAVRPAGGATAEPRRRDVQHGATVSSAGKVSRQDVLDLTHELALMLRAGLPLAHALRVLLEMSHKPPVQALVRGLLDDVKGGAALSRALESRHRVFGGFFVSMVRAGEAGGELGQALERLAEHLGRMAALREGVISSLIYPAILLAVALLSLVGMMGFVVPQFEKLFVEVGDALPLPTQIVLGLSHHARAWGVVWMTALAIAGLAVAAWLRTPNGRLAWQALLLRLPVFGRLIHTFQLAVFARTLGTLVGSGVPLLGALDIAAQTVPDGPVRRALAAMAVPIKSGSRLAPAMEGTGQFEPLAINLIRVGEETGRLGPLLSELANMTDKRVETGLKRLLTMLEPALIVVLGLLVAGIVVAILLGILSINEIAV